jgi:hypothetical protein
MFDFFNKMRLLIIFILFIYINILYKFLLNKMSFNVLPLILMHIYINKFKIVNFIKYLYLSFILSIIYI